MKKTNEAWTNLFEYVTVRPSVSFPIVTVGSQQQTLARERSPEVSCDKGEGSLGDGGIGRNEEH